MSDQDRRGASRHPHKGPVKLRPTEGATHLTMNGESVNLSENGLLFSMDRPPAVGSVIDLAFVMPGQVTGGMSMKVRCKGRVVRVDTGLADGKSGVAAHIERFETIVSEQQD